MHQKVNFLALMAFSLCAVFASSASAATLSTNFFGGAIGGQPTPPSGGISTELAAITNFGGANTGVTVEPFDGTPNLGQIAFLNNGSFYVGGNRAYGFAGPGRSDITFDPNSVAEITIQVRGSDASQSTGPSTAVDPVGPSTTLGTSDVTLLIWSNVGVQSTTASISNTGFQSISLDVNTVPGDFISRVSLINESSDPNSIALIGFLDVTLVPEPATAMLGLTSLMGLLAVRRRS